MSETSNRENPAGVPSEVPAPAHGPAAGPLSRRRGGILLHPTSLANAYPIGDIGPAAEAFIDVLHAAGQHWWQVLPINPVGEAFSPYKSPSTFAISTLLISPDRLCEDGWLDREALATPSSPASDRVDYPTAQIFKDRCLQAAYERFASSARAEDREAFDAFVHHERHWLPDYALFEVLRNGEPARPWWTWDLPLRHRESHALAEVRRSRAGQIRYYEFAQWQLARQWKRLRDYAKSKGVALMGDVPIFAAEHSADVWAHPDLFTLSADGSPAMVAGVPPDYFAKTGQLWGNPHYRWSVMKHDDYQWWTQRFKTLFRYFDALRIDHFLGFCQGFHIPAEAKTAQEGHYKPGPGAHFFEVVLKKLGTARSRALIAEDLGNVTEEAKALRDEFALPGMRVLQFGFGDGPGARVYQPHRYPPNSVAYTGTHDNNTTVGWYREVEAQEPHRADYIRRYLATDARDIHWDAIRAVWASPANTAMIPMQDLLGLGAESRMNQPGIADGNWSWRMASAEVPRALVERLRWLTETYERI